ncbi:sulfotransferase domain-containing protein [Salsipaludibacter albus]|uniref:sulfotransferase domain-containing protein n=1 Tax=Salsipaludibacter albus TaxID=2849650 RepID=UPI001EE4D14E|nr:sulfotransferase domain-containing protein [Salsipaludibacter albus]MBY5162385.1 sulfotransferase domain-containing protein [Salsipaludibacter albus]
MRPRHYTSADEDSARWDAITLRDGDVVVSTRSKHGTTWVQAILLMLEHGPVLPAPLPVLSPWVDHLVEPVDEVAARLEAQQHRRVLKTHTPLDGLALRDGVHVVVVARHPLDAALSLYHQGANIDRGRLAELTGAPTPTVTGRPDETTWLVDWIHAQRDPIEALDSLQGVAWHVTDAWARRDRADVTLVHYADLATDLPGQVRRLARRTGLGVDVDLDAVVEATRFDAMRDRATALAPDTTGVLRDRARFFRGGRRGDGVAALPPADLAAYRARMAGLVPPDLDTWLHR